MSWGGQRGWWIGPFGFLAVSVAANCSDGSSRARRAESSVNKSDGSGGAGGDFGGAGGILIGADRPPDPVDEPPDPGPQPFLPCGDSAAESSDASASDAGEFELCALPRSRCVDHRWLVYYAGGGCIDGVCRWEQFLERCAVSCDNDGCFYGGTASAPP